MSAEPTTAPGEGGARPGPGRGLLGRVPRPVARWALSDYSPIWMATAVLFLASAVLEPNSLSANSLASMFAFAAILAVASAGQTIAVQQRGMDLSVAGNITLCALVLPIFMTRTGAPLAGGLLAVAVTAIIVGLVNGLLVAKLSITPLIATLSVNALLLGATLQYTDGIPSAEAPKSLADFAARTFLGLSLVVWVALVLVVLIALALSRTVVGRRFVAVGTNPDAARAAGLPVDRYIIGAYVAASLCFAVAAVLLVGYLGSASVRIGADYLFPTIAAVVVGGTSFAGGKGSVIASAVAAVFLTQLVQLLLTMGAPTSAQFLAQALAIAVAAGARTLSRR